jgi:hypothetical protein
MAVGTVSAVIDPHLVVLGGGIGSNPQLLAAVRDVVGLLLPEPPRIESSKLGSEASLYGAVDAALDLAHRELLRRAAAADDTLSAPLIANG